MAASVAAVAELGGATTRTVRGAASLAAAGAVVTSLRLVRRGGRPSRALLVFDGAVITALLLHLWTYAAAPVGTTGLVADLLYWLSLAVGAALGVALAAGRAPAARTR